MNFPVIRVIYGSAVQPRLVESAAMENAEKLAVRWMDISAEQAGQRIDNFLLRVLKGVPKSRIYRLLRKGEVRVNKGRIRPAYRLQSGDQVRIPPVRVAVRSAAGPASQASGTLADAILYEDDRLLVLNKPAGMAVHGGSGLDYGVIEALRAARPQAPYLELVHRLDRATSGCLMVAKRRSELRTLHELLRNGGVEKRYLLLVQGDWSQGPFRIDAALRKNQIRGGERIVRVDPEGKTALTHFRFLDAYPGASLMEAELKTGRTHQIRVHTAHAGHPLAGDEKYGAGEFNRRMRDLGLKRMFLHAHYVAFEDSERGRSIEVSAPLGADLRALVQQLENTPDTGHNRL
ncbi:MAG: 23S rRNA pseudouridine(955/2504/2580) synthase RluC [Gammaproteobacteria bacterium]|nr:MAG: 23S rRNA pseudouridine(955/2504/2580) synthase RluC [Gammaproteobacteria bacterium]